MLYYLVKLIYKYITCVLFGLDLLSNLSLAIKHFRISIHILFGRQLQARMDEQSIRDDEVMTIN